MPKDDTSDTAIDDPYKVDIVFPAKVRLFPDGLVFQGVQGKNQFSCSGGCGTLITVSDKKAAKLRKMRKPKVTCNKCKKVRKARFRK